MYTKIKIVYWKGEKFWLGKILEHPEIMSQGETVEELEENLKDAYKLMLMDDVPSDYHLKEISVCNAVNSRYCQMLWIRNLTHPPEHHYATASSTSSPSTNFLFSRTININ